MNSKLNLIYIDENFHFYKIRDLFITTRLKMYLCELHERYLKQSYNPISKQILEH